MQKNLQFHYLTLEQRETLEKLIRSRIGAQRIAVHSECNRAIFGHDRGPII